MGADEAATDGEDMQEEYDAADDGAGQRGDDREPFFQVLMSANRDRVVVQGLLNNATANEGAAAADFGNGGDTMFLFNENHVLRRLGLARIESEEELRELIKPSHREFLYECLNVIKEKRISQLDISNGA